MRHERHWASRLSSHVLNKLYEEKGKPTHQKRKAGAREPKTYETELDLPGPVVGWNEGWPRAGTPRARKSTRPSHLALTRAEPTPRATTTPKRRRKWERTDRAFHGADSISNPGMVKLGMVLHVV